MSNNLNTLNENEWRLLLSRIEVGKCTPFLGAGACKNALPLGSEIARLWAQQYEYPLQDPSNLTRVAQYLAVQFDPMFPKEEILRNFFKDIATPDFKKPDMPYHIHHVLAGLPLPIYMTTNYDDFMLQALREHQKNPQRELCRWKQFLEDYPSIWQSNPKFEPTVPNPLVFHLHGHDGLAESLVLTEDDYLDFAVNTSRSQKVLPHQIERALSGSSLLFVGYSLEDWTFKVLYRGLVTSTEPSMRRISVTVQLQPPEIVGEAHLKTGDKIIGKIHPIREGRITIESPAVGVVSISKDLVERVVPMEDNGEGIREKQQEYLRNYFNDNDIRVYWGTAEQFAVELRERWEKYCHENQRNSVSKGN